MWISVTESSLLMTADTWQAWFCSTTLLGHRTLYYNILLDKDRLKFIRLLVEASLTLAKVVTTAVQIESAINNAKMSLLSKWDSLHRWWQRLILFMLLEADLKRDIIYCMSRKVFCFSWKAFERANKGYRLEKLGHPRFYHHFLLKNKIWPPTYSKVLLWIHFQPLRAWWRRK